MLSVITIVGTFGCGNRESGSIIVTNDGFKGMMSNTDIAAVDGIASNSAASKDASEGIVYIEEDVEFNTEEFSNVKENRFLAVKNNPLSTFAADVDTASYATFRRYINNGNIPHVGAIRIEEMINYFKYEYDVPTDDEPFSCNTELVQCPWNKDTCLLSIGLVTKPVDTEDMPRQNLVFLLDTSGSMYEELDLVKRAFLLLCDQLTSKDIVSIVTYAGSSEVVLKGAEGDDKATIMQAIEELETFGGTNGSDGIKTAYEIAEKYYIKGGNNRIILATDGDLNLGVTTEAGLTDLIKEKKKSGVYLSVLGFGYGNYSDTNLEALADNGNGNYNYIDSIEEARKALITDMGGTLVTVAKDVKLQVEFNPSLVKGYRLIGYENRLLNAEDFADDTVDGGEIGAGHRVTALYEVVMNDSEMEIEGVDLKYQNNTETSDAGNNEICTVSVRAKEPDSDTSKLWEYIVKNEPNNKMSDNLKLASAVAQVGMLVNESEYAGTATYKSVLEQLDSIDTDDSIVDEFKGLVKKLSKIK